MSESNKLKKGPTGQGLDPLAGGQTVYSDDVKGDAVATDRSTHSTVPVTETEAATEDYAAMNVAELKALCKTRDHSGYSSLKHDELVGLLEESDL